MASKSSRNLWKWPVFSRSQNLCSIPESSAPVVNLDGMLIKLFIWEYRRHRTCLSTIRVLRRNLQPTRRPLACLNYSCQRIYSRNESKCSFVRPRNATIGRYFSRSDSSNADSSPNHQRHAAPSRCQKRKFSSWLIPTLQAMTQ